MCVLLDCTMTCHDIFDINLYIHDATQLVICMNTHIMYMHHFYKVILSYHDEHDYFKYSLQYTQNQAG